MLRTTLLTLPLYFLVSVTPLFAQPRPPVPATKDSSQIIADRIIKSPLPVLVDFWAPWCGPCRVLNPLLDKLEKEYHGKVTFIKVNVDRHRQIANYFGVSGIPAVFIIVNKTVVHSLPGLQSEAAYRQALKKVLAPAPAAPDES